MICGKTEPKFWSTLNSCPLDDCSHIKVHTLPAPLLEWVAQVYVLMYTQGPRKLFKDGVAKVTYSAHSS